MSLVPVTLPGFVFRGRTYKTVSGLYFALAKDAGAERGVSAADSHLVMRAFRREGNADVVVKNYCISRPVPGQKQFVAECLTKSELTRDRRNALVASAYNAVVACREPGTPHGLPDGVTMGSVGLPDEPRRFTMDAKTADGLPANVRAALLIAYGAKLMAEQQAGQQMVYTFADCDACVRCFVNV